MEETKSPGVMELEQEMDWNPQSPETEMDTMSMEHEKEMDLKSQSSKTEIDVLNVMEHEKKMDLKQESYKTEMDEMEHEKEPNLKVQSSNTEIMAACPSSAVKNEQEEKVEGEKEEREEEEEKKEEEKEEGEKDLKQRLSETERTLERTTRLLERTYRYNEELRAQVERLSTELHVYRTAAQNRVDADTQVDEHDLAEAFGDKPFPDWGPSAETAQRVEGEGESGVGSIADSLKAAAQQQVWEQSGFVFDSSTGLYYNCTSGYYYDSSRSLYYDPNTTAYFYYDETEQTYKFHSYPTTTTGGEGGQATPSSSSTSTAAAVSGRTEEGKEEEAEGKKKTERSKKSSGRKLQKEKHKEKAKVKKGRVHKRRKKKKRRTKSEGGGGKGKRQHKTEEEGLDNNSTQHSCSSSSIGGGGRSSSSNNKNNSSSSSSKGGSRGNSHSCKNGISLAAIVVEEEEEDLKEGEKEKKKKEEEKDKDRHKPARAARGRKRGKEEKEEEEEEEEWEWVEKKGGGAMEMVEDSSSDSLATGESEMESEPESGELTDSSSSSSSSSSTSSSSLLSLSMGDHTQDFCADPLRYDPSPSSARLETESDISGSYPPCIRVVVQRSEVVEEGTFFLVTCPGGTVGRDPDPSHAITLPDINISKMHADIRYDEDNACYTVTDLGSQNGTFINELRISQSKERSSAVPLSHGDVLGVGSTRLLLHIHPGTHTCDLCEPGQVLAALRANAPSKDHVVLTKNERKKLAQQQLKEIKKKYGLANSAYVDNMEAIKNANYADKAELRRRYVGSEHHSHPKPHQPPASVHRPISSENKGHRMLARMGWKEGSGLGRDGMGRAEPVAVEMRADASAGLGSQTSLSVSLDNAHSADRLRRLATTRQRYRNLEEQSDTGSSGGGGGGGGGPITTPTTVPSTSTTSTTTPPPRFHGQGPQLQLSRSAGDTTVPTTTPSATAFSQSSQRRRQDPSDDFETSRCGFGDGGSGGGGGGDGGDGDSQIGGGGSAFGRGAHVKGPSKRMQIKWIQGQTQNPT